MGAWLLTPVDVAREMGAPAVIAVDPTQAPSAEEVTDGLQAVMRAREICYHTHAHVRIGTADLVLRPHFSRHVDVLDFGARRMCMAVGIQAVRAQRDSIRQLLEVEST